VYNYTERLWHCCGDDGCTGTHTSEIFEAVPPSLWSAVPSAPISSATHPSATASAEYNGTDGTDLSPGTKIGIGVSAAIAGLAILARVVFFVLWRRSKTSAEQRREAFSPNYVNEESAITLKRFQRKKRLELSGEDAGIRELASERI
jgi:hypothetical protein